MTEEVRPLCMFCHQRFVYEPGDYRAEGSIISTRAAPVCDDPRTPGGRHVEFSGSTKEQRDARFGAVVAKPTPVEHAAAVASLTGKTPAREQATAPQMGFGL